jgi:quinol monooxygenase YgiN
MIAHFKGRQNISVPRSGVIMVVATMRVLVPPYNRLEILQTFQSLTDSIRSQKGCLNFHYYLEMGDENAVYLIEEWETQADLDNHLLSRDFAVLFGAINLLRGSSELEFKLLSPTAGIEAIEAARGRSDS